MSNRKQVKFRPWGDQSLTNLKMAQDLEGVAAQCCHLLQKKG